MEVKKRSLGAEGRNLWARCTNEARTIALHENARSRNYDGTPVIFLAHCTTRPAYVARCSCKKVLGGTQITTNAKGNQGSAFARCPCRRTCKLTNSFTETIRGDELLMQTLQFTCLLMVCWSCRTHPPCPPILKQTENIRTLNSRLPQAYRVDTNCRSPSPRRNHLQN